MQLFRKLLGLKSKEAKKREAQRQLSEGFKQLGQRPEVQELFLAGDLLALGKSEGLQIYFRLLQSTDEYAVKLALEGLKGMTTDHDLLRLLKQAISQSPVGRGFKSKLSSLARNGSNSRIKERASIILSRI